LTPGQQTAQFKFPIQPNWQTSHIQKTTARDPIMTMPMQSMQKVENECKWSFHATAKQISQ
jgi:hypothetical protein